MAHVMDLTSFDRTAMPDLEAAHRQQERLLRTAGGALAYAAIFATTIGMAKLARKVIENTGYLVANVGSCFAVVVLSDAPRQIAGRPT